MSLGAGLALLCTELLLRSTGKVRGDGELGISMARAVGVVVCGRFRAVWLESARMVRLLSSVVAGRL